jgi:hypothetical protein
MAFVGLRFFLYKNENAAYFRIVKDIKLINEGECSLIIRSLYQNVNIKQFSKVITDNFNIIDVDMICVSMVYKTFKISDRAGHVAWW